MWHHKNVNLSVFTNNLFFCARYFADLVFLFQTLNTPFNILYGGKYKITQLVHTHVFAGNDVKYKVEK